MKQNRWYKKIAAIMAAGMLLAAALPVQASSNANVISTTGASSYTTGPGANGVYHVDGIPFTISYKPVSGSRAPEQNFVFVLEPETAGAPMPSISADDANKNTGEFYAETRGGKNYYTVKMPAVTDGTTKTVKVKLGEIAFDEDVVYSYRLYQQIPRSGDANYSAYIDQNAQGGKYDTTTYTIKLQGQLSDGKRELGVSVFRGTNNVDKTIPEFANEYKPPIETPPTTPPPTPENPPTPDNPPEPETPQPEPPTVLGALRSIPEVLGAMRDQIMTGDTSALTIATVIFAGTCIGLAVILANNRKKHENEDNAE